MTIPARGHNSPPHILRLEILPQACSPLPVYSPPEFSQRASSPLVSLLLASLLPESIRLEDAAGQRECLLRLGMFRLIGPKPSKATT